MVNSPRDRGSILGRVIPKTQYIVLNDDLFNSQHYKVQIKGKVVQLREWISAPPFHLGVEAIERGAFVSPLTKVANFTYFNDILEKRFFFSALSEDFSL